MNIPDEPMFYTVFSYELAADDYVITGIFSVEQDAEARVAECNAQPRYCNSAHVQRLTHDQIVTLLVKDRIREMAAAIDRLTAALREDRADRSTDGDAP